MDLKALNEKLRREVLPELDGPARQRVLAEIHLREDFVTHLDENLEVECACGLHMTRASYYEHQKATRHPLRSEREKSKRDAETIGEGQPPNNESEAIEVCSCGLLIPASLLQEHMQEAHHIGHPQQIDFSQLDKGVKAKSAKKSRRKPARPIKHAAPKVGLAGNKRKVDSISQ